MGELKIKAATYEDVMATPPNMIAEILNGRLITQPRPAPRHSLVSSGLGVKLGTPFHHGDHDGPGGWWILDEPELHLGDNVLVPDLAGWQRERMPKLPKTAWFETVPDWVCEVLSPSTAKYDRHDKRIIYAASGVKWLWLIDPNDKILEAFELRNKEWVLIASLTNDDEVAIAPFAAVPFMLNALWEE